MKYLRTGLITAYAAVILAVPALADIITEPTPTPGGPAGDASWLTYGLLVVAVGIIVAVILVRGKKKGGGK